jgi:hypothetical protein
LGAGEIGFESDTNKFKIGTGSTAWVSLPYASNVSPLTTKGDLYTYSTDNARLAVGANGETLVADSSTSTGLRYTALFGANKNKVINGDFGIWQRGTSFSNPAFGAYLADRWRIANDGTGATRTITREAFTLGAAPVAGYESQFFYRYDQSVAGSGGTFSLIEQRIEDVRTFAGQTVTLSFWAKSAAASTFNVNMTQNFGSGGSTTVSTVIFSTTNTTTSFVRYSATVAIPSISGKTIGAGSFLGVTIFLPINTTFTTDFWGVQLEAGSVATAFQTATGTIQGELAACQRYYYRLTQLNTKPLAYGANSTTSVHRSYLYFPVEMRIAPSSLEQTGTASDYAINQFSIAPTTCTALVTFFEASTRFALVSNTLAAATLTLFQPGGIRANADGAFLGWSAEL